MNFPSISFGRSKPPKDVLAAVGPVAGGIAVARVKRGGERPGELDVCEFRPTENLEQQRDALFDWSRAHALDRVRCTTPMEKEAYSLLLVEAPEVPEAELAAAVRWRVKELIDFPVEDAVVDVFDIPAQKDTQRGRMVYAVVARAPMVKHRIDLLVGAGLNLDVVDIPELAQRNVATCLPEDAAGLVFLHLSKDSGAITLTRQSTLYFARRLEYGLDAMGVIPDGAEGLQLESVGLPFQTQSWMDNLVIEIQRSLDYYESHYQLPSISNLVIAPLEQPIPGMAEYFSSQLGLTVRVLDLNAVIDCRTPMDPALQVRCFQLIGAALRDD